MRMKQSIMLLEDTYTIYHECNLKICVSWNRRLLMLDKIIIIGSRKFH